MKRLQVLLFALLLSTPAIAAVQTLAYGIYVPRGVWSAADSSKLIMQDTTLALSGKRIIIGSLHDPAFNCVNATPAGDHFECGSSFEKFRELEKSTSYHNAARGDSGNVTPSMFSWQITTAGDSVVALDSSTGRIWWVLVKGANNACGNNTFNDLDIDDGKVNVATSGGKCEIDFPADQILFYSTSGISKYSGTINQRNAGLGSLVINASPAIVNNTVNSVSAIRDPGGKRDALGRLAQWWVGGTETSGGSAYNPYTNTIFNSGNAVATKGLSILSSGVQASIVRDATRPRVFLRYNQLAGTVWSADEYWDNNTSGSEDLAWGNATVFSRIAAIDRASWAGTEAPLILVGADSGLVALHAKANDNTNGGQQLVEFGFNSGYMKGTVGAAYPLESGGTDISPNAYNLTSIGGTHTYVNGVIGKGDSLSGGAGWLVADKANLRVATGDWSYSCWFKSINASNPGTNSNLMTSYPGAGGPYMQLYIVATSGYLAASAVSTATNSILPTTDVYDGNWHFVVWQRDGSTEYMYLDGELCGSVAVTHGSVNNDTLTIGALYDGTQLFTGVIDNPQVNTATIMTPTEIRAMYRQGLAAMQNSSTAFPNDALTSVDVDYVQSLPTGMFVAGDEDTATVFNRYGIPVQKYATPGGSIQDAALIAYGADSVGVVITTTTKTQLIQPDVRGIDLAQIDYPFVQPRIQEPVVVDSSGKSGVFWQLNDAAAAVKNMNWGSIFVAEGVQPASQVLSQDSLRIQCSGNYKTVFNGGITSIGLSVTGKGNTILDCGAKTTSLGGQTFDAFSVAGIENTFIRPRVLGSDDDGYFVASTARHTIFEDASAVSVDGYAANIQGPRTRILDPTFSSAGSSIIGNATSDSLKVEGGQLIGATGVVHLQSGADRATVVGVTLDGAIEDHSTGTVTAGNQ